VEAVCKKVIIINKGQLVATDSVEHLKHRGGTGNAVQVQLETAGVDDPVTVQQRLEQVPGVSKVLETSRSNDRLVFEVNSLSGHNVRPDVARAIVQSGWNLLEMKSTTFSLEEVFLQLTGGQATETAGGVQ
jgi:ABC-2 type transport system ATP-binding protein